MNELYTHLRAALAHLPSPEGPQLAQAAAASLPPTRVMAGMDWPAVQRAVATAVAEQIAATHPEPASDMATISGAFYAVVALVADAVATLTEHEQAGAPSPWLLALEAANEAVAIAPFSPEAEAACEDAGLNAADTVAVHRAHHPHDPRLAEFAGRQRAALRSRRPRCQAVRSRAPRQPGRAHHAARSISGGSGDDDGGGSEGEPADPVAAAPTAVPPATPLFDWSEESTRAERQLKHARHATTRPRDFPEHRPEIPVGSAYDLGRFVDPRTPVRQMDGVVKAQEPSYAANRVDRGRRPGACARCSPFDSEGVRRRRDQHDRYPRFVGDGNKLRVGQWTCGLCRRAHSATLIHDLTTNTTVVVPGRKTRQTLLDPSSLFSAMVEPGFYELPQRAKPWAVNLPESAISAPSASSTSRHDKSRTRSQQMLDKTHTHPVQLDRFPRPAVKITDADLRREAAALREARRRRRAYAPATQVDGLLAPGTNLVCEPCRAAGPHTLACAHTLTKKRRAA